jgi:anionic cell wall polymer biosynthesis LytR-Cps2A-Psr (LCP) family protein
MRKKRARKYDKGILLLIVIVMVVGATAVFAYLNLRTDVFAEHLKEGSAINMLFAVSGDQDYRFFSVFSYDPRTHKGALIFIPGNVGSIIESLKRVDRIDVLYRDGDLGPLRDKVEQLTGLEIKFMVDLTESSVRRVVDIIGGLELFIPNPVDSARSARSAAEERRTLLPSGSVLLDGDKVASYISYRETLESEVDRVGRKQKFLQALLGEIGSSSEYLMDKSVFPVFRDALRINLSARALGSFVREMKKLDAERLIFQRVLGSSRVVDNKELLFPHFDGELLRETVKQTQETIASQELLPDEEVTVTLEVLNGTQVTGLAARAANIFRSFGYDIVTIGNADGSDYQKTVVLDRRGKLEPARRVAELIKCERVYTRPDEEVDVSVDITLILGKDFDGRYCKE